MKAIGHAEARGGVGDARRADQVRNSAASGLAEVHDGRPHRKGPVDQTVFLAVADDRARTLAGR